MYIGVEVAMHILGDVRLHIDLGVVCVGVSEWMREKGEREKD